MLKKVSLFFVALACAFAVNAQDQTFKKFRVGLAGGYAVPGGSGAKGGVLINLEPAYRLQDKILVGIRFEGAVVARGFSSEVGASGSASFSGSNSLFGQYYLSNNTFRPYVGLGVGMFSVTTAAVTASGTSGDSYGALDESKFGFFPKIGFDLGHFSMGIDFNLVGKSTLKSMTSSNEITTKNNYVGIRIGGFFGGGRK